MADPLFQVHHLKIGSPVASVDNLMAKSDLWSCTVSGPEGSLS